MVPRRWSNITYLKNTRYRPGIIDLLKEQPSLFTRGFTKGN